MSRYIDADALKIDISRLHALNDEAEIRRAYELNPHSTMTDFEDTLVSVFDAIDDAPTIEVPEWIPCSERLPNNDEEVIVSVEDDRADNIFKYTTTAWRYGDVWVSDNERICGIIAWMPLPKPYEETDHE